MERPSHAMPSPVESAPLPEVVNHTPWPSQYFQHVDPHGEIFHVMVSRISYTLRAVQKNGDLIEPTVLPPEQQTPLCTADEFYANVNISSVLQEDRKSTRLNSSHLVISYAVFCLKKKKIAIPHYAQH